MSSAEKRKLVALSGIDGAGKSTQLENLKKWYSRNGDAPICLWSRGGYTSGINFLKSMARSLARGRLPDSGHSRQRDEHLRKGWIKSLWLMIAILDLARMYGFQIRWWQLKGRTIICDRYLWDTLIDFKLAFPDVRIEDWFLWKFLVWFTPRPDAAFLLIIPLEESERRCRLKFEPFPDSPAKRKERYLLYQEFSKRRCWKNLDGLRSADEVFAEIIKS